MHFVLMLLTSLLAFSCGSDTASKPALGAASPTTPTTNTNTGGVKRSVFFTKEGFTFKGQSVTFDVMTDLSSRRTGTAQGLLIASENKAGTVEQVCDELGFYLYFMKPISKETFEDKDNFTDGYFNPPQVFTYSKTAMSCPDGDTDLTATFSVEVSGTTAKVVPTFVKK